MENSFIPKRGAAAFMESKYSFTNGAVDVTGLDRTATRSMDGVSFLSRSAIFPHRHFEHREPSNVPARSRQTLDKALTYRVSDAGEDDWECWRRVPQGGKRGTALSNK